MPTGMAMKGLRRKDDAMKCNAGIKKNWLQMNFNFSMNRIKAANMQRLPV